DRLEVRQQCLTGNAFLAARRRLLAAQLEASRQRGGLVADHGWEAAPCRNCLVDGTRCGGVVQPFDALTESGTRGEALLEGPPGRLSVVLAAREAPGLVEYLTACLVEPLRNVFPWRAIPHDSRPLVLDGPAVRHRRA